MIVLDECHSLSTDATFADAPFHIEKFIRFAIKQDSECKFIFMTGMLSPIKWLLDDQGDRIHVVDYFGLCHHVTPKHVEVISKNFAKRKILSTLGRGGHIVFFVNSIDSMVKWGEHLESNGISEDVIGVLYAKNEDNKYFSEALVKKERKS